MTGILKISIHNGQISTDKTNYKPQLVLKCAVENANTFLQISFRRQTA